MLGFRLVSFLTSPGPARTRSLALSAQAELCLVGTRAPQKRIRPMSAKKARKTRPRKQPAPSSTAERARSSQSQGKTEKKAPVRKALSPLEVQLRKTLAEMGLARARRVFAAVEASFDD